MVSCVQRVVRQNVQRCLALTLTLGQIALTLTLEHRPPGKFLVGKFLGGEFMAGEILAVKMQEDVCVDCQTFRRGCVNL